MTLRNDLIWFDANIGGETDPVARVLEAWEAEVLQSVVDQVMVARNPVARTPTRRDIEA
jgi:hypothetical protein